MLSEHLLRTILTLAEELHFGRAAVKLHLSQSALSGVIKRYERELGVRLFQRTSRHVELTPAGKIFVAEARRLLEESARSLALVRGSSPDTSGPLRIGYTMGVNVRWLFSLAARAGRVSPFEAELQLINTDSFELHEKLIGGSLHAAFFAGALSHSDLETVALCREPFRVVVSSRHPLARTRVLRLDALRNEPFVWLRRDTDHLLYDHLSTAWSASNFRPRIVQEVRSFAECIEFARAGLGASFVPASLQPSADRALAWKPVHGAPLLVEQCLAWLRNSVSPDVSRLSEFAREHAGRWAAALD